MSKSPSQDILIEFPNQPSQSDFNDSESMDVVVDDIQSGSNAPEIFTGKHAYDDELEFKPGYSKLLLSFDTFSPQVQSLFEDLQSLNASRVSNAIFYLSLLSKAVGPEKTRLKLLPHITNILEYIEEQEPVLNVLAQVLNTERENSLAIEDIGGIAFINESIIPLLGDLIYYSDSYSILNELITDASISWLKLLPSNELNQALKNDYFKLDIDYGPTISIFSRIVGCIKDHALLKELIHKYLDYLSPSYRMWMRMKVIKTLESFIQFLPSELLISEPRIISSLISLSTESDDIIRVNCLTAMSLICSHLAVQNDALHAIYTQKIIPSILSYSKDSSWKVRYSYTNQLQKILKSISNPELLEDLIYQPIRHFLNDSEPEIRSSMCKNLIDLIPLFESTYVKSTLFPIMENLLEDKSHFTRAAIASCVGSLAMHYTEPSDEKNSQTISNFLNVLLRDANTEVRLNALKSVSDNVLVFKMNSVANSLVYAIVQLANDSSWRVRMEVLRLAPVLSEGLGLEVFQGALCSILLICLVDRSYCVRIETAKIFSKCSLLFGMEWVVNNLFPTLLKYTQHASYLNRQAALFAIGSLVPLSSYEVIKNHYLPIITQLSKDKVPNVRYCIVELLSHLNTTQLETPKEDCSLKNLLNDIQVQLLVDTDLDVRRRAESLLLPGTTAI